MQQDITLVNISRNMFQNNPIGIKAHLMMMQLVTDLFEPTHENFVSLLASLPQEPDKLAMVIQKAFAVPILQGQGAPYIRNVQNQTGASIADVAHAIALKEFSQAASQTSTQKNTEGVAAQSSKQPFSDKPKLTPLGWVITIVLIIGILGGAIYFGKGIYQKFKKS
jgi:cobalamin biosynthesis Mg chelatase CobN